MVGCENKVLAGYGWHTGVVIEIRCIGNIGSIGNKVTQTKTVDVTTMFFHGTKVEKLMLHEDLQCRFQDQNEWYFVLKCSHLKKKW